MGVRRTGGLGRVAHYGRSEELLPRYAWYAKNSDDRAWPVGRLRPNDLGLFDALGNATEWVEEVAPLNYPTGQLDDAESKKVVGGDRVLEPPHAGRRVRPHAGGRTSASRIQGRPSDLATAYGFRPVRTLPESPR